MLAKLSCHVDSICEKLLGGTQYLLNHLRKTMSVAPFSFSLSALCDSVDSLLFPDTESAEDTI